MELIEKLLKIILVIVFVWAIGLLYFLLLDVHYQKVFTKNDSKYLSDYYNSLGRGDTGWDGYWENNVVVALPQETIEDVYQQLRTSNDLLIETVNKLWVNENCGGFTTPGSYHTISISYSDRSVRAICNDDGSEPESNFMQIKL